MREYMLWSFTHPVESFILEVVVVGAILAGWAYVFIS